MKVSFILWFRVRIRRTIEELEEATLKLHLRQRALVVLFSGLLVQMAVAAPTLIENVQGYTLHGKDLQEFSCLVFDQGKILAVGDAAKLKGDYPDASKLDGHGKTLLPGMIDAHGHILDLGDEATEIGLGDTKDLTNAQSRIEQYAKANPARDWLIGGGWNQVRWHLGRFPTARELDHAESARPVVLWRIDGHAAWVNTKALKLAGITRDTKDPEGGRIERSPDGEPSGVLVDKAMNLVVRLIPEHSDTEQRQALRAAMRHMNSVGLTSVGDAGVSRKVIELYRDFADHHLLTVRIYAMIRDTGEDFDALSKVGPLIGYGNDFLNVRAVKLFSDGALGSRGAAMRAAYSDAPDQHGLLFMVDDVIRSKIEKGLKAGYQVNVHAIGDAANHQVLDGFETAFKNVGGRDLRNRIEHAQVVAVEDIPRFKSLGIIASMQPTHATSDMNMAEDRVGKSRIQGAYAWRSMLDQGTVIAGGSDFPVESDNPFYGLHAAVTRTDHEGKPVGGWHPEQAISLQEAFRAFTLDAAYAQHQEQIVGSLEPGKRADFILVDQDIFRVPKSELWKTKVLQTWVEGIRVFEAK